MPTSIHVIAAAVVVTGCLAACHATFNVALTIAESFDLSTAYVLMHTM